MLKQRFFDIAKKYSKFSEHPQHKLGAVIVKKNRVISVGYNKSQTHPKSYHRYKHLHAEIYALIGLDLSLSQGCVAYIYRETKNGHLALAKPCYACEWALRLARIKTIYYTVQNGYREEDL